MTTDMINDYMDSCIECWPMVCVHCGSTDITYSVKHDDAYCENCGMWQVKEDEE